MATTFDVNRIGGGTFELVQDPATGRYSYQKVGFTPVKSLTIPELGKTTTAATDTAAAAKSATEQTVKQQTTEVFRPTGGGSCLLYTSPSPRDRQKSRMPSSA